MINVYTDGATVGINGKLGTVKEVGLGILICENNSKIEYAIKAKGISNNEAEFLALIFAMQKILEMRIYHEKNINFHLDSQIVVNRANNCKRPKGRYKNERMDNFQDIVLNLKSKIEKRKNKVKFYWIPREENYIADALSKKACNIVEITEINITAPRKENCPVRVSLFEEN
jgi:ribonuclease HI